MEKWVIQLDEIQLGRLSLEPEQLGTYLTNTNGEHFLVFRDGFVALKVANRLGAKRRLARSLASSDKQSEQALAQLANGDMLVAEFA